MNNVKTDATMHLIANITHQAINPIGGVIGTLDNIIDGTISPERRDQRLRSARAQLEYTVSLIRNLAFFAEYGGEISSEKRSLIKTTVIPQNLIEAAMFFQEQGKSKGLTFEVKERQTQNSVKGDPDLMRQVFMNIFDNFVKYGTNGATIEIRHWIQKKTGDLIIEMEGASTPFDAEEDIFALGVRGKNAETATSSGSGLGLHICKLIIEKLFKGKISASYAAIRKTAKFEIRIPGGFISERS
ncbi:ATP-binding protein [Pseudomonas sp. AA-38]|uniref:sensor histidine kinase n=1 Tax=Pseudomonas sp. AA-38 TaxID=3028807 RepID=UPI0023F7A20C|nr:ATP-binding protein [Pseudomonas sp. AA-38]